MMNKLQMKFYGDNVLREVAAPVAEITDELRATLDSMVALTGEQMGAGLAAPQVGISQRFLVMYAPISEDDMGPPIKMINPKIVSKSDACSTLEEGCLSILGPDHNPVFANVERAESVVVEWTDELGAMQSREFSGFAARVVQHEIDHLDGILFIDHLSSVKREQVVNKTKKRKN